jgi:N1-aminopropylagmatine ureohydrolase
MSQSQFSDAPQLEAEKAWVHLLPVPLEATVSYGGGTSRGPAAILEASYQLENYDRELGYEPGPEFGIFTHPEMTLSSDQASAIEQIERRIGELYQPTRLLGVLGGEHSLTGPVVRGLLSRQPGPITIVQLDAHCDLRDQYEGSPLSHACVARRLLELQAVEQVIQLGIRSLCSEEAEVIRAEPRVTTFFAEDVHSGSYSEAFLQKIAGRQTYLTIDVDGFDSSLVPSTGTPEPNGLTFQQVETIVATVVGHSDLLAFDCVELAPISGFHAADYVVAKLLYRLMSLAYSKRA